MSEDGEVTELLESWNNGDKEALDQIVPLVLQELRDIARRRSAAERSNHTLPPTALVNELYLRLRDKRRVQLSSREDFFAIASTLIRRILVDYARTRQTRKRGRNVDLAPLEDALNIGTDQIPDLILLDDALTDLEKSYPRKAKLVELHIFSGLTFDEIPKMMNISRATAIRDWNFAKLWLSREISVEQRQEAEGLSDGHQQ